MKRKFRLNDEMDLVSVNEELENIIIEEAKKWVEKANKAFRFVDFSTIELDFELEGTVAGRAGYDNRIKKGILKINMDVFLNNKEEYINQTIPHEIAHIISDNHFGREKGDSHGDNWKRVMLYFGKNPKRCHNYEVKKTKTWRLDRFQTHCKKCGLKMVFSKVIYNKMLKGKGRYCNKCETRINPKDVIPFDGKRGLSPKERAESLFEEMEKWYELIFNSSDEPTEEEEKDLENATERIEEIKEKILNLIQ
jgi:SprT protein